MRLVTKQQLIEMLQGLAQKGWIESMRPLNAGGVGNTIDALLGLPENNLPIADTAQWEMKTHRVESSSLLTLFHMEPEPRAMKVVSDVLLPKYGWPDQTRSGESSFRQTIQASHFSDRGFAIVVDRVAQKMLVHFDPDKVDPRHAYWLKTVEERAGLGSLNPQPYWDFKELFLKASTKLLNTFYVEAESKREKRTEFFRLIRVHTLQEFNIDRFTDAMEAGAVLVDFDARTHHNHGTKFRLRQDSIPRLYRYADSIVLASPDTVRERRRIRYEPSSRLF